MMQMRDQRKRRKNKDKWVNRMALMGITVIVAFLAVVVNVKGSELRQSDFEYEQRELALESQKAEEELRALTLEEQRIYVQTKQYIEKIAKEKLGLVNKDEILLKPSDK